MDWIAFPRDRRHGTASDRVLSPVVSLLLAAICFLGPCCRALAQVTSTGSAEGAAPAPATSFEVASIRAVPPSQRGPTSIGEYGLPRFSMKGASLQLLISFAFAVDGSRFTGAPKGLEDAVFDLDVKSEGDVPLTYERLKPLMQRLLRQRFGLVAHTEVKQVPGYGLVVAKGGPKLTPAAGQADAGAYIMTDQIHASGVSLATFAAMLGSTAGKPVTDATGITGSYDFTLHFAPPRDADSTAPSLFTALREQFGLQLQPEAVPVDTLIIEKLNKTPTDN